MKEEYHEETNCHIISWMELSDQNTEDNVFEKVKFKRNKQEIEEKNQSDLMKKIQMDFLLA